MGNVTRKDGESTRLIDYFVQQFFKVGYVKVFDHSPSEDALKSTWRKFMNRMEEEHDIQYQIKEGDVVVDKENKTLYRVGHEKEEN